MAANGTSNLTMADWAKQLDPNGRPARIVEILTQTNDILADMTFMEGNLPTGHRTAIRTGLASAYWRLLNQGGAPSKGTTAQVTEQTGILESLSRVDVELAKLGGNPDALRLNEGKAHLEGMNQEMASTLWYGAASAPEEFIGFSSRYSSLSAANAQNIVDGGGTDGSDNSSIWLIGWGDNKVSGIFPQGSTAGVQHTDFGVQLVTMSTGIAGEVMPAYVDLWQWKAGIVVEDWRYAIRIANIDMSALIAESSDADLTKLMTFAYHRRGGAAGPSDARWAFYMNRTCAEFLDVQRQEKVQAGGQLGYKEVDGKLVMTFRGIPIRTSDALLETEAAVS